MKSSHTRVFLFLFFSIFFQNILTVQGQQFFLADKKKNIYTEAQVRTFIMEKVHAGVANGMLVYCNKAYWWHLPPGETNNITWDTLLNTNYSELTRSLYIQKLNNANNKGIDFKCGCLTYWKGSLSKGLLLISLPFLPKGLFSGKHKSGGLEKNKHQKSINHDIAPPCTTINKAFSLQDFSKNKIPYLYDEFVSFAPVCIEDKYLYTVDADTSRDVFVLRYDLESNVLDTASAFCLPVNYSPNGDLDRFPKIKICKQTMVIKFYNQLTLLALQNDGQWKYLRQISLPFTPENFTITSSTNEIIAFSYQSSDESVTQPCLLKYSLQTDSMIEYMDIAFSLPEVFLFLPNHLTDFSENKVFIANRGFDYSIAVYDHSLQKVDSIVRHFSDWMGLRQSELDYYCEVRDSISVLKNSYTFLSCDMVRNFIGPQMNNTLDKIKGVYTINDSTILVVYTKHQHPPCEPDYSSEYFSTEDFNSVYKYDIWLYDREKKEYVLLYDGLNEYIPDPEEIVSENNFYFNLFSTWLPVYTGHSIVALYDTYGAEKAMQKSYKRLNSNVLKHFMKNVLSPDTAAKSAINIYNFSNLEH